MANNESPQQPGDGRANTPLVLKNDHLDAGTWVSLGAIASVAASAGFIALLVANVRDPNGRWLGPELKAPQVVY
jgi:hypothetical protein